MQKAAKDSVFAQETSEMQVNMIRDFNPDIAKKIFKLEQETNAFIADMEAQIREKSGIEPEPVFKKPKSPEPRVSKAAKQPDLPSEPEIVDLD